MRLPSKAVISVFCPFMRAVQPADAGTLRRSLCPSAASTLQEIFPPRISRSLIPCARLRISSLIRVRLSGSRA